MSEQVAIPEVGAQARLVENEPRLPRPPGLFRRWLADHPRLVDGTTVFFYLLGCMLMAIAEWFAGFAAQNYDGIEAEVVVELSMRGAYLQLPWLVPFLLVTASIATALWFRRRVPLAGVILVSLVSIFDFGFQAFPNSIALVFLLYAVPVYRSVLRGWIAYGIAAAVTVVLIWATNGVNTGLIGPSTSLAASANGPLSTANTIALSVMSALWLLVVVMVGINMGNRRRYVQALIDRAHQLVREREQRAQLAAAAERSRIAREMHDIVAHSLSVVVTLAEGASVAADSRPEEAKRAMERAAETGRTALVEMRRLLGVLRESGSEADDGDGAALLAPQPGVAQLPQLIEGFREAGLHLSFSQRGEPCPEPAQQLAVYRIAQEALTNALRYAGVGSTVSVKVAHRSQRSVVEVVDRGPAVDAGSARPGPSRLAGAGMGLAGARQRAAIFGGILEAGPYGRGWRVLAEVPFDAPVPGAGEEPL